MKFRAGVGGVSKTAALAQLIDEEEGLFFSKAIRRLEKYIIEGIAWDSEKISKDPKEVKADSFKIIAQLAGRAKDEDLKIEFNENLLEIYAEKQIAKTPQLLKNIEIVKEHIKTKEDAAFVDLQIKGVRRSFRNLQRKQKQLEKELQRKTLFIQHKGEEKEEIQMLNHQIGLGAENIKVILKPLKEKTEKGESISNKDLLDAIDNVLLQAQIMSSITSFVTKARFDFREEEIEGDLALYMKQYVERVYLPYHQDKLTEKDVIITIDCQPDIKFERIFNPFEFVIVIDNLIDNAIKANANHITVTIQLLDKDTMEISFKDDGDGIDSKDLGKIFNFGFSTTGGTGMGLHHVKKILKEYGEISVNSSLTGGTEFLIKVNKK